MYPVARSTRRWILLSLVALSLLGCSAEEGARVQRTRTGDTLVVLSLAPRIGDTLVPLEVARIGRPDGPLEYIFNMIFSFTAGAGEVLVHDEGEGIRRFDLSGQYLGHLAREGQGPAEVLYARGIAVSSAGTVAAHDIGNARIILFTADGETRSLRQPIGMPSYQEDALLFHDDGSLWVGVSPPGYPEEGVPHPRPVFARVDDSGALLDTIFTPESLGVLCPILSDRQNRAGFWEDRREPYFPKAKWALGPNGTLTFGCSAEYRFDIVRPGSPVIRVQREWTPQFMSEERKDFIVKWGVLPALPKELPAYARIVVPGDGRIWVWPTQPEMKVPLSPEMQEAFGETHAWSPAWQGAFDVYSEEGEWLAVVRLPSDARYSGYPTEPSIFIRGDTIWAVAQDSLGVQYVVRYEVEGIPKVE